MTLSKAFIAVLACGLVTGTIWAKDRADSMKVTVLGTGTPYPHGDRFGSAILVEAAGKKLLFDCGRGVDSTWPGRCASERHRRSLPDTPALRSRSGIAGPSADRM